MMTSAFYMAYFMMSGVHMPFWPLWLEDWGLSPAEVGLFTAAGMGARVVAGLTVPAAADRLDRRRHTIAACLLAATALFLAHLWIGAKAVLLAATLSVGAALAGIGPISEALGVAASRAHAFPYAQARGVGSMGFLAANLAVGALIARVGVDLALWWIVACLSLAAVLVVRHPGGRRVQGQAPPRLGEIGRLFVNPTFALFVATAAFIQAGHAVFYGLGSVHWVGLGLSEGRIGALWAAGVGAEIVFMLTFGAWAVGRLGAVGAMAAAGAAGVLRWGAMTLDPVGWTLWPLQGLHAATFALGHLGAMAFVAEAVPQRFGAAAQGAMNSIGMGLVLALAMAAAAALYPLLGGRTYGIGVALSGVGLALCLLLARRWRGGTLVV
jgi:PPP family 3-phenylpropionic acid transporter